MSAPIPAPQPGREFIFTIDERSRLELASYAIRKAAESARVRLEEWPCYTGQHLEESKRVLAAIELAERVSLDAINISYLRI